jgi:protease IV
VSRRPKLVGWVSGLLIGLALFGCEGRHSALASKTKRHAILSSTGAVVEIDLSSGVPESTSSAGGWFPLPANRTYTGLVRAIERIEADRNVKSVFIRLGAYRLNFAQVEELSLLLGNLRQSHKIVCHAHSLGNATLWLTLKGCDRTWLSPAGDVDAIGIGTQVVYFHKLLDGLGVKADFLAVGRWKSAAESFLRDEPSEAARQEWLETLSGMRKSWIEGVASARPAAVESLENGPWGARAAIEHHLIDALGDEGAAIADAQPGGQATVPRVVFGAGKRPGPETALAEILRLVSGAEDGAAARAHIAVVPLAGAITMGSEGLLEGDGIVHVSAVRTIDRLIEADDVRAVVLRIDSPGGSALASDLLWTRLRKLAAVKPLVVSVGAMAASGGYYLACAGARIFAESTSIVGSIGVVGGKIVFGPALERHGVHAVTLSPSPDPQRVVYESPLVAWDDATRARVLEQMTGVYDLFVDRVAEGRKLKREQVLSLAEGRIYTGTRGKELGLVDEIGGLARALEWARTEAGLDTDAPVTVEGPGDGLLAALGLESSASLTEFTAAVERQRQRLWSPLSVAPQRFVPLLAGLTPLLYHERVLALMPVIPSE